MRHDTAISEAARKVRSNNHSLYSRWSPALEVRVADLRAKGLSYTDIGKLVGMSAGAVKNGLKRREHAA